MKDISSLRARLKQSGLKPASSLPTPPPRRRDIPGDWPGRWVESPRGDYYVSEHTFPMDFIHGNRPLGELLALDPLHPLFEMPGSTGPSHLIFMDTETTGLAGGSGTFAFLVGTGGFTAEGFTVRQYFLPDPSGEAGLLEAAVAEMEAGEGLVTFNGRGFDVPILQTRTSLRLRRFDALSELPHLDLLFHARRLWRRRLESCSLGSLEQAVLAVHRTQDDVPGWLIPDLYRDYLRGGDPAPLSGVLYHNAMDILSLVVLAAEIHHRYNAGRDPAGDPLDRLALGFVHFRRGELSEAGEDFRAALAGGLPPEDAIRAHSAAATMAKRTREYPAAVPHWQAWATLDPADPTPNEELAKYYEWHLRDLAAAAEWAGRAAAATSTTGEAPARRAAEHRIARLKRKMKE